ncbi:MAG TPA: hypothetical protein DCL61_06905 [Cyanobacteria bacterium UBA12227]|nr:hypothetical protein [Cyanobacteria bacterium UBA12227]HAX87291.1 hypothetical protein [Cyanobacteria bacterium UBA11370]HBY75911.1 hypothetical protein [Cyanobacteria bacterium UBA11148]
MAKRSLQASAQGIKEAKIALDCKNLTQKAITTELQIASWSTVNKFFTGQAVDRRIFIEICEALDLEWDEIAIKGKSDRPLSISDQIPNATVANPNLGDRQPTVDSPNLLEESALVERNATRARSALNPYILPRLRRQSLLEKCLKAIHRGVTDHKQRIIPILGAAGYGKSTLLGKKTVAVLKLHIC